MKTGRSQDLWYARGLGAASCVGLLGIGAAVAGREGAVLGALAGVGTAVAIGKAAGRRERQRRQALAGPFPETWRAFLADTCDHYDRLTPALRGRFEDDLRIFLAEKRITGVGFEAGERQRLMVAASAVTLSVGWPDFEWDVLTEVLLYPEDFDRDYGFEKAELAGQAHPWGTIILSVPALEQSFADPDDGFHVGFHELAHLLDLEDDGRMEGIPGGLSSEQQREWSGLMTKEMDRLQRGKSVIDEYGADEPAEFFAVAVESFFECALALRQRHRELYAFLSRYFAQDPAAWDDARGLYV
jgi:Mlc titration factor MtfA (ptsG expression regulator)